MASMKSLVIFFAIVAVVLPTATMATEFWVGDSSGWTVNFNYEAWAKDKVFNVGDTLVFNYTKGNHNVFKVDGAGFKDCVVPPANEALESGHDVITLKAPGKKWYICGVEDHCAKKGQKLVIIVEGGAPAPAPGGWTPAPSGSPSGPVTSLYHVLMAAAVAAGMVVV